VKLWLRVALVAAVVSLASLLLTGVVAQRVAGDAATRTAVLAQERDAAAIAASVARWVDDRQATLVGWALVFPVADLDEPRRIGLVRGVLKAVSSATVVTLVDGDGVALVEPAFFEPGRAPLGALATDPVRARALAPTLPLTAALGADSGTAVGAPYLVDGSPRVPVAVVASLEPPIVLGAELAIAITDDLRAQTGPDRLVALIGDDGTMLTGPDDRLPVGPIEALLGTTANMTFQAAGEELQGAIAPVGTTGWSVVVVEPVDVALEGARRIRFLLPWTVAAAMALAVLLGLVLGRTVTEPIARLRTSVLAVAEGRLGVRADVSGADEVGELARAFNHMSARLLDNQEEIERQRQAIESFNLSLQSEVDEATRELREAQGQLVRSGQLAAVAQIGAGLAHELNNPLTAVLGLAQILAARDVPEALRQDLADLEREARRCREVVDALLRLTVSGEPAAAVSDASELLDQTVQLAMPAIDRRGVEVTWDTWPAVRVRVATGPGANALAQLLTGLASGLPAGSRLDVHAAANTRSIDVTLRPSVPVALENDDWMASGIEVWVARQTLDRLGVELVEPLEADASWVVRLPVATP
jgi:signal transduction histidine kinase